MGIYINKTNIISQDLPGAGNNFLANPVSCKIDYGVVRIYVCISIAGVLSIYRTHIGYGVSITELLNEGNALVAGASYTFYVPWVLCDTINLRYSTTGGTIYKLQIDEGDD